MINKMMFFKSGAFVFSFLLMGLIIHPAANAQTDAQVASLTKAVKFDDVSEVKTLLSNGMSPNQKDPKGMPMLMVAMQEKSAKTMDYLINAKGINLEAPNVTGETPLMFAALYGYLPEVKTLVIDKQVDVNMPKHQWGPLHYACTNGHLSVAEFLIARGAQVDALSPSDTTPLMMAIRAGNIQLVRLLLENGADIRIRNHQGFSAIDVAELFNQEEIRDGLKARWKKLYKQDYPGGPKPAA